MGLNIMSIKHLCLSLLCVYFIVSFSTPALVPISDSSLIKIRKPAESNPLVTFQVATPVPLRSGDSKGDECVHTTLLMDHVFAFSYGQPFVGIYISYNQVTPFSELIPFQERIRPLRVSSIGSPSTSPWLPKGLNSIAWVWCFLATLRSSELQRRNQPDKA